MEEKKQVFAFFFKRLHGKPRERMSKSRGLRWKAAKFNVRRWFIDRFLFKILSVFEAVVMVSTLCFFYLCCGYPEN
ncbi:hypothetical protein SSX86_027127 [Deinandra increscens subsp. villosa]|uniref:Uncharacterized protein n=1 Tax=Deinandra increscens subsp. villosa TaxID=3103831 RepID=A0AAP0GQU2_9ASTR